MSTDTVQNDVTKISFWRKSFNWIRAFEEAIDFDPRQASVDHLRRQVAELRCKVDKLERQLSTDEVERS